MKQFIKMFYDAAPEGTLPPSLADLSDPNYKPAEQAPGTPPAPVTPTPLIKSGDGESKPDELDPAKAAADTEEKRLADEAAKKLAEEGGEKKEGEEDEQTELTVEEQDKQFWETVDKLRGKPLPIEYPAGVDPMSPEGLVIRDKAVGLEAVEDFEAYLEKRDPRSYAYMLHRQEGGTDEEFFAKKTFSLPEYTEFQSNADIQTKVYTAALTAKGLDADMAKLVVDKAIKDGKLLEYADIEYKLAEKSQLDSLAAIEQKTKESEAEFSKSVAAINQKVTTAIKENKGVNIIIPETEKAAFTSFLNEQIEYDKNEKKFLFVMNVGDEDFGRQVEALYLLFKKGDLKSLVARQAATQATARLRRDVESTRKADAKPEAPQTKPKAYIPLGDL